MVAFAFSISLPSRRPRSSRVPFPALPPLRPARSIDLLALRDEPCCYKYFVIEMGTARGDLQLLGRPGYAGASRFAVQECVKLSVASVERTDKADIVGFRVQPATPGWASRVTGTAHMERETVWQKRV
jgi:hypothetical protein